MMQDEPIDLKGKMRGSTLLFCSDKVSRSTIARYGEEKSKRDCAQQSQSDPVAQGAVLQNPDLAGGKRMEKSAQERILTNRIFFGRGTHR
ncbi:MAG: hypothetical protein ACYC9M_10960 [Desulfobulbaceae bacterium]